MLSIYQQAEETLNFLEGATDLTPHNLELNKKLSAFVHAIQHTSNTPSEQNSFNKFKQTGQLSKLHQLLGQCEYNMEEYWAHHIGNGKLELNQFLYKKHYESLTHTEINLIKSHFSNPIKSMAFIGSGPLPLSALLYQQTLGTKITAIDYNPSAHINAKSFISSQGADNFNFVTERSETFDYTNFDLVFIASLIDTKEKTLQQVKTTNPSAIVAVRTVTGLNEYLYKPFLPQEAFGYKQLDTTTYNPLHINQTILFKPI